MKTTRDQKLELVLNEFQADIQVLQLAVQEILAIGIKSSPTPKETLVEMQKGLRNNIKTTANISADPKSGERLRQLTLARCDRFFQTLNRIFGVSLQDVAPGKVN